MDAIYKRRSIRRFTPEKVPEEAITEFIRAGMNAPSAANQQPWRFVVIDDRRLLNEIPAFHQYSQMLLEAPVAILVCGDMDLSKHEGFWVQDCSAAVENMLLEITDRGTAGCGSAFTPGRTGRGDAEAPRTSREDRPLRSHSPRPPRGRETSKKRIRQRPDQSQHLEVNCMDLKHEEEIREEAIHDVARKMLIAARTAPKGRGVDNTVMALAGREAIRKISDKLKDMVEKEGAPAFFGRDAESILSSPVMLLLGTRIKSLGLGFCGLCGFKNCAEKDKHPEIPCSFNTGDLGIAVGPPRASRWTTGWTTASCTRWVWRFSEWASSARTRRWHTGYR